MLFTIRKAPVAKPRGRQLAVPNHRASPGVLAWRAFDNATKEAALKAGWRWGDPEPLFMLVRSYHAIPESWSRKAKLEACNTRHRQTPDQNHVWNAVADSLFPRDERLATGLCSKWWDDGAGPRVLVLLTDRWPHPLEGVGDLVFRELFDIV